MTSAVATPADPMVPRRFRIVEKKQETADTYTFAMVPVDVDGGTAFRFSPGQFNMLYLFGFGEVPVSISGDPDKPEALVHTARAMGGVTRAFAALEPGEMVGVRGPFGSVWPVAEAEGKDVLIVAGGLGLAPLRSAIYALLAARHKFRKIVILHGARSPEAILFGDDLRQWRENFDVECEVTVDYAGGDWYGRVGVITQLVAGGGFDAQQVVAFVCGPEIMMRFAIDDLNKRGVADDRIHVSMERSMKCAIGHCGHCQLGPAFICKDGPVMRYDRIRRLTQVAEL